MKNDPKKMALKAIKLSLGLGLLTLLGGCISGEPNPLLVQPPKTVVPALLHLEKIVQAKDLNKLPMAQEEKDLSLFYLCSLDPVHFSNELSPNSKACQFLFEKIVFEARKASGPLKHLTLEDLNDKAAQQRLRPWLEKPNQNQNSNDSERFSGEFSNAFEAVSRGK